MGGKPSTTSHITTLTISVFLLWLLWRWRALELLVRLLHARHRERVVRTTTL